MNTDEIVEKLTNLCKVIKEIRDEAVIEALEDIDGKYKILLDISCNISALNTYVECRSILDQKIKALRGGSDD